MSGAHVKMSDTVSLFGGGVPADVELLYKHLKDLDRDAFKQILAAVVKAVDGQDCSEVVRLIAESSVISEDHLNHAVAGLYALLKEARRLPSSSLRQEVFNEDLRALRVSEEFIAELSSVVFGSRQTSMKGNTTLQEPSLAKIDEVKWRVGTGMNIRPDCNWEPEDETRQTSMKDNTTLQGPSLPKIDEFKWRVDVAISTSSLSRALQPSILMQIKLSDGCLHCFEVPVAKFQELRYNVSLILKEMNDLEKRSILKIQD